MKPSLYQFLLHLLVIFCESESAQLTQDIRYEESEPNDHLSGSSALSSLFYSWASLYHNPSELIQLVEQLNITDNCKAHIVELLFRLASKEYLKQSPWAMQIIDSWGKFPEGILEGHLNTFGDYDECVRVDVSNLQFLSLVNNSEKYSTKFRGLYCTVALQLPAFTELQNETDDTYNLDESNGEDLAKNLMNYLPISHGIKIFPSVGTCFPNSCLKADVNTIVGQVTARIGPSANAMVLGECTTATSADFDAGFWVVLGILILLLAITVIGTTMDLIQNKQNRKVPGDIHAMWRALQPFSVVRNMQKFLETEHRGEFNLECIHGIRFLTMLWIILYHTWAMLAFVPMWNAVDTKKMTEMFYASPILNGFIGVDTFLTVTGLLTCHSLLKACEKSGGRLSLFYLYVHRFVRLTPPYAVLVAVIATVLPNLSSGPFWFVMENEAERCRANWWTNLLYFNNFFHTDQICAGHGWYLAVDMQLYIVAPLIIYPLWRHPRAGLVLLSVMTLVSILTPGLQAYFQEFPPTNILSRDTGSMWWDAYIKPWTYLQSYIAGIWLGRFLFRNSSVKGTTLSHFEVATGWVVCTGVALAVLCGIYPWFNPKTEIPQTTGFLYASLHRFAWGSCICWVIYACSHGHGGYINRFLSWSPFVPLGRLTFCTYLVSLSVMATFHFSARQPFNYSFYSMTYIFIGHAVMSLSVGFIWAILFESPFVELEKLVCGRKKH